MRVLEPRRLDPAESILGMPQYEFIKLSESIIITIPHRQSDPISQLFEENTIWTSCGTKVVLSTDNFGGFIEMVRGSICRNFLLYCDEHPEVDKLVMIDSDESVHWSAPYKLAMWDLPVVSGIVCNWSSQKGIYAAFTMKDKYGVPRFPSVAYTKKLPSKGLLKPHSIGTGLVCIKKDVIRAIFNSGDVPFYIPEQIRKESMSTGVMKQGEDTIFCEQVRKLGFEIFVDLSVHAHHYKRTDIYWPVERLDTNMNPEDFEVDIRDYYHG